MRSRLKAVVAGEILNAAAQVFAEQGLEASMEAIAARAGVAVGTLYNHFADRQQLLLAIAHAHQGEVLRRLEGVVAERALPFRERLLAAMQQVVEATTPATLRLRVLLFQDARHRATVGALKPRLTRAVEQLLVEGRKAKLVRPDPEGLQATMLVGMLMVVLHRCIDDGVKISPRLAHHVVSTFLDGVGPTRPTERSR